MHPQFQPLIDAFLNWASTRPEVRAAVIVDSQARAQRTADTFSDLDLVIVTTDPHHFLEDGWLNALGAPIVTFREPTAMGSGLERRVLFEPGLDVDLVPIAVEEWAAWVAGQVPAGVVLTFACQ